MGLSGGDWTIAITGGARGIGLETARVLAESGHRLALADLDGELAATEAGNLPDAKGYGLDVTDRLAVVDWLAAVEADLGPLDVLINCAGICPAAPRVMEQDRDTIRQVIEVNLNGTVNTTLAAIERMLTRGRGQVVNIASLAGLMGVPGLVAYSASKHGVIGFTESLRAELNGSGIDLAVVMPGPTATRMMDGAETGKVVKLVPPGKLARKIAGLVGTDRTRMVNPRLDGFLARLAGNLPPRLAMRISKLLGSNRIYTNIDAGKRAGYEDWLHKEAD